MATTFSNVIQGVALGDSWGNPNEFQKISSITKNSPKGPDLPQKLIITDDTQMSLWLAAALDDAGPDATIWETQEAIIDAFLQYHDDPMSGALRAPGVTVMGSLGALSRNGHWQTATSNHSDGSGTVMRTSPTAFLSEDRWVGATAFAAAVTHGTANAIAAALIDVAVLREELAGSAAPGKLVATALDFALNPEFYGLLDVEEWLDGYEIPKGLKAGFDELARLLSLASQDLATLQENPWATTGDVSNRWGMSGGWRAHETLVIALVAVDLFPNDPWSGLRRSVTSDGDSDTIGAVAGALVGATGVTFDPEFIQRMEPRYIAWIGETEDYVLAPVRKPLWRRIFSR